MYLNKSEVLVWGLEIAGSYLLGTGLAWLLGFPILSLANYFVLFCCVFLGVMALWPEERQFR